MSIFYFQTFSGEKSGKDNDDNDVEKEDKNSDGSKHGEDLTLNDGDDKDRKDGDVVEHDMDPDSTHENDNKPSSNDIESADIDTNQTPEDSHNNIAENDGNNKSLEQEALDDSLDVETMDSFLTKSIRKSLTAPDPDVREAAHRLLRDRMIETDRISERSASRSGSESSAASSTNTNQSNILRMEESAVTYGAVKTADTTVLKYSSMAPMGGGLGATLDDDTESNTVGETTSLLGNNSTSSMGAMNNFG